MKIGAVCPVIKIGKKRIFKAKIFTANLHTTIINLRSAPRDARGVACES